MRSDILKLPELLSPAGDFERLEAAVMYGADAVYLGGKTFGMRSSPQNFAPDELANAVSFCHGRGVKVYLTCNTLPTNSEADLLPDFIAETATAGIDALIVADIGVLMVAKRIAPELPIHISTQAGVVNHLTARELYSLGASRVVLARELSLEDIAEIRAKTPPELELETFVHGAMCMSFSGRCLISQYLTGRDGNHGDCSQPCRWSYALMEERRPGQYFPVIEDEKGCYILNAQDLSMLPHIDKLISAGVSSFKIEGRAKSAYYAAVITNCYRQALEIYKKSPDNFELPEWLLEESKKVSHREYSTGFYLKDSPAGQYYENSGYVRDWDVVAVAEECRDGMLMLSGRNRFFKGDELEILEPGKRPITIIAESIYSESGEELDASRHPMAKISIPFTGNVASGALVRKKKAP